MQQDDEEDGDEDDSEMVYEEFQEVIMVFCCFTMPIHIFQSIKMRAFS